MMPCMDLQTDLNYDAAVDEVYSMLCDEAFRKQVCEATHARSYDVSVTPTGDGADVRVSRVMPAPDMAKKLVGDTLEIVQVERWGARSADGTRTADLSVDIPGKPASMRGRITLTPAGEGATEAVSGDIKVKVPLIGGKLEGEIARALVSAIKQEGEVGARWLSG